MAAITYSIRGTTRRTSATYRRRRFFAVLICAVLPGGFVGLVHAGQAGAEVVRSTLQGGHGAARHVYVVQPGDTLWDVARATHPHGDLRAAVDRLAREHGRGTLQPGERISW